MVEVIKKQTDFKGLIKEIFWSTPEKDIDDKYSKWEQENKIIIKNSDTNIMKLITETNSSKNISKRAKKCEKIVETVNIDTQNIKNFTNKKQEKANREK